MLNIKEHGLSAISETCYYSDSWIYSYINEYFYLLFNLTGDESSFFYPGLQGQPYSVSVSPHTTGSQCG